MKLNIEELHELAIDAETVGKIAALCSRVIPGAPNNDDGEGVANHLLDAALNAALEAIHTPDDWNNGKIRFTVEAAETLSAGGAR